MIMRKLSLRMRITLLAGAILLLCSVIITIAASYNAGMQFASLSPTTMPAPSLTAVQSPIIENIPFTNGSFVTAAKQQFDTAGLIILIIVSIGGMGMVYFVAGRSLKPIHDLSKKISAITGDNLQLRIPEDNRNDEVGALSHSFNVMMERLEKSFLKQKRFSANVAHELKTPLATINASLQVLRLEESPSIAGYEESFATTERNVNRLIAIVDDLMRLCDEQEEFFKTTVDLQSMFESVLKELGPLLNEKHIAAELNCRLQTVTGNPVLLYRACFNLVQNAAKYNMEGGKILIETGTEGKIGQIIIRDTGIGISAGELPYIFDPFYRVDKSRSRKEGGAGLGLSLVKTIVEKHGWKISVSSVLGLGSAFTISFIV